jgi:hypothetical protein
MRLNPRPRIAAAIALTCLLGSTAWCGSNPPANPTTLDFPAGGVIKMELHAGGVEIVGTKENKITVHYTTRSPEKDSSVEVKVERVVDGRAFVRVNGPNDNFNYRIEVPEKSDLVIRMSAGDLQLSGIRGNKDIELHAGNMELRLADPDAYGKVDGSVSAGGLSASPWGVDKGGLLRSFHRSRKGEWKLHAHVGAGNLELRRGD